MSKLQKRIFIFGAIILAIIVIWGAIYHSGFVDIFNEPKESPVGIAS